MPEMPEIQAHSERMAAKLVGLKLAKFELLNFAGLKTFSPPPDGAVGHTVGTIGRRAKYLLIRFGNGHTHVIHLMQGGRLRPDPKQSRKPRNGIARWVFESEGQELAWLLTEAGSERKAGLWVIDGDAEGQEPLSKLAPEATDLNREEFGVILRANSMRLHGLLRSQRIISGLGRMLANEICFLAALSPFANASRLGDDEEDRLHQSIRQVVKEGIKHERTLDGIGRSADRPSRVHNRSGRPCRGTDCRGAGTGPCEDTIASVEYRSYTVFYCPTRQTKGKLLADNTTSKFLK